MLGRPRLLSEVCTNTFVLAGVAYLVVVLEGILAYSGERLVPTMWVQRRAAALSTEGGGGNNEGVGSVVGASGGEQTLSPAHQPAHTAARGP